MELIERQIAINKLVDNDINTIIASNLEGDDSYVASIFEYGMKGYANFTDEELQIELYEIFGKRYEVIADSETTY